MSLKNIIYAMRCNCGGDNFSFTHHVSDNHNIFVKCAKCNKTVARLSIYDFLDVEEDEVDEERDTTD